MCNLPRNNNCSTQLFFGFSVEYNNLMTTNIRNLVIITEEETILDCGVYPECMLDNKFHPTHFNISDFVCCGSAPADSISDEVDKISSIKKAATLNLTTDQTQLSRTIDILC